MVIEELHGLIGPVAFFTDKSRTLETESMNFTWRDYTSLTLKASPYV